MAMVSFLFNLCFFFFLLNLNGFFLFIFFIRTQKLIAECELTSPEVVCLDLCCGEGSTAIYIAERYGGRVTGIDIVSGAIKTANEFAKQRGIDNKVTFVEGNIFKLPFADASFDVVYGQDPDGLSHPERVHAMREVYRVLKPGGLFSFHHHWIGGFGFSEAESNRLGEAADRLNADFYVSDVQDAGFRIKVAAPIYELADSHIIKNYQLKKEKGKDIDSWLQARVDSIGAGHKYGVQITAVKPLHGQESSSRNTLLAFVAGGVLGAILVSTLFSKN